MELKKNPKADLERRRSLFFQIGLAIVLSVILFAFELKINPDTDNAFAQNQNAFIDDEIIPITQQEPPKVEPPPPPPPQEVLEIVENNEELQNEANIENTESDANTQIQAPVEVAQEEESDEIVNFYVIENKPTFGDGSDAAVNRWIAQNVKYPEIAKEAGVSGKVFVQFVIGKDGKVTDVQLLRGVDPYLDKEALRVVSAMPAWKPGSQRGKPVKVSFQIPINFKLN